MNLEQTMNVIHGWIELNILCVFSFLAVEQMRLGFSPNAAAEIAIGRIREKYSKFSGAVITANKRGEYGAACSGLVWIGLDYVFKNRFPIFETANCISILL